MISKERLHRIYTILSMLAITLCGCYVMVNENGDKSVPINIVAYYLLTFAFLFVGSLPFLRDYISRKTSPTLKWLSLFLLWTTAISFLYVPNIKQAFYPCLTFLIPMFAAYNMYSYTSRYGISKPILWTAVLMQLLMTLQYFQIYIVANVSVEAHLMVSYYPMFLLPLVLMHPSKTVRYASIIMITFVIFSSVKRGGLVGLAIGLVVYILSYRWIQSKGIKSILYGLLALSAIGGLFMYIASTEYGAVMERMTSIADDGGSGRTSVWLTTIGMIQATKGLPFLIGHGFSTVVRDSILELSAHNDFLEAWYDFGLVGMVLYIAALVSLVRYSLRQMKAKVQTAPCMLMMLSLMLINSMISIVILYFLMTLCCMTLGLLIGENTYQANKQIEHGE